MGAGVGKEPVQEPVIVLLQFSQEEALFLFWENLFVKGSPSPSKSGPNSVYLKSALKMVVIFALDKIKTCNKSF